MNPYTILFTSVKNILTRYEQTDVRQTKIQFLYCSLELDPHKWLWSSLYEFIDSNFSLERENFNNNPWHSFERAVYEYLYTRDEYNLTLELAWLEQDERRDLWLKI